MNQAVKFKHTKVPPQEGEKARLKVVRGPDYGAVYVLTGVKVTIGRGEDNDVVISDLKSSRLHAEISLTQSGWRVRDMGSSNGILFNDKQTTTADLKVLDTITLGETTLEFFTPDVAASVLMAAPREVAQIQAEQSNFALRQAEIRAMAGGKAPVTSTAAQPSVPAGNKKLLLIVVALGVAAFLYLHDEGGEQGGKKPGKKNGSQNRDLASYLPEPQTEVQDKTSDVFFKVGFREYRERNYLRAKTNFETVLQISPSHSLARLYLGHCENAIKQEVKYHLDRGKKSFTYGRLRQAKGHFEAAMRLLYREQQDPRYLEAKEQLELVEKERRGEGKV